MFVKKFNTNMKRSGIIIKQLLPLSRRFNTNNTQSLSPNTERTVRRVRELLRPFILAVHPDRYHGLENKEIKSLNEESLKRLNGFFDMLETRSSISSTCSNITRCESKYKFAFNTLSSKINKVNVTVKIPPSLRSTTISTNNSDKWLNLAAGFAVDLLNSSDMKVPSELLDLKDCSVSSNSSMPNTNTHGSRKYNHFTSMLKEEDAVDAAWAKKKTMELTQKYSESVVIDVNEEDDGDEEEEDVVGHGAAASKMQSEKLALQASVVNQIFKSKRISVTAKGVDPSQVLSAAEILRELLLKHYDLLHFGHPEWSSVIFLLCDGQKEMRYTFVETEKVTQIGTKIDSVYVHVPVIQLIQGGMREESKLTNMLKGLASELLDDVENAR
jgi:hypothetical protein